MSRHALAICAISLASVLVLGGCGSDAETQSSDRTTATSVAEGPRRSEVGQPFAARARAACEAAVRAKREWKPFPVADFDPSEPDSAAFPQVAAWLETEVAPTFQSWLDGLTRLGAPPSGQESWGDVLAAVDTIVDLNAAQVAAAKTNDAAAFAEARDDLQAIQPELERATAAAGVPTCADVHK